MPRLSLAGMPLHGVLNTSEKFATKFEHDKEMESYGEGCCGFA
jgi:hypothetical protein